MQDHTVLIVEDNPINLKVLRDLLMIHGYSTIEAVDGPSGLDMALKHLPNLILLDIQMPEMNGYEVARLLKNDESTMNVPIIAVSSFAMNGEEEKALASGCDGYIKKPIDIRLVIAMVKKFLGEETSP